MPTRGRVITGGFITAFRPDRGAAVAIGPPPFMETWTVSDALHTLSGDFPWVDITPPQNWQVFGQRARLATASGAAQAGYLNRDAGTDDLAVTLGYPAYTPGTGVLSAGPMVRLPGIAVFTGYCATVLTVATSTLVLFRFLAGGQVQLGPSIPVTPHPNMTVGVSALGNRIRASFDGSVRIDVTDVGIPSGHFVGLQGFSSGDGAVVVDDLAVRSATARAPLPAEWLTVHPMTPLAGVH